jgi:hypothetical protein
MANGVLTVELWDKTRNDSFNDPSHKVFSSSSHDTKSPLRTLYEVITRDCFHEQKKPEKICSSSKYVSLIKRNDGEYIEALCEVIP